MGIVVVDLADHFQVDRIPGPRIYPVLLGDWVLHFRGEVRSFDLVNTHIETGEELVLAASIRLPAHHLRTALTPDRTRVAVAHIGEQADYIDVLAVDGSSSVRIKPGTPDITEPALGVRDGRTLLAWVATVGDVGHLHVADITSFLP